TPPQLVASIIAIPPGVGVYPAQALQNSARVITGFSIQLLGGICKGECKTGKFNIEVAALFTW
ncbi:hypothetical protein, partial [Enterocloster lavalensis]|uniref:hypothetical protein n=1 Tax=Enterocloster lavalensis TaxID=460384 RepID=UPI002FDB022D